MTSRHAVPPAIKDVGKKTKTGGASRPRLRDRLGGLECGHLDRGAGHGGRVGDDIEIAGEPHTQSVSLTGIRRGELPYSALSDRGVAYRSPGLRPEIAACYVVCMSKLQDRMIAGFTAGERDYIRRELDIFFSTLPSVAEG